MKTIKLFMSISFVTMFAFGLSASSYMGFYGKYNGKGFTLKVEHAIIFNIRRDKKTGKLRDFEWKNSGFQIVVNKGFLVAKTSYLLFKGKKHYFAGFGDQKKGYFSSANSIGGKEHVSRIILALKLLDIKKGRIFFVNKRLDITRNPSFNPKKHGPYQRLKITVN